MPRGAGAPCTKQRSTKLNSTLVLLLRSGAVAYYPRVAGRSVCPLGTRLSHSGTPNGSDSELSRRVFYLTLPKFGIECPRGFSLPRRTHVTYIHHDTASRNRSGRSNGAESSCWHRIYQYSSGSERISTRTEALDGHNRCGETVAERFSTCTEAVDRHNRCGKAVTERFSTRTEAVDRHNRCGKAVAERFSTRTEAVDRHFGSAVATDLVTRSISRFF